MSVVFSGDMPSEHWATSDGLDRIRNMVVIAAATITVLVVAGVGMFVLASLSDAVPDSYVPSSRIFIVTHTDGDSRYETVVDDDGVPLVDPDGIGVPIQLAACSTRSAQPVRFTRTWVAAFADGRAGPALERDVLTRVTSVEADTCAVVGGPVPVPERVLELDASTPGLTWAIQSTSEPLEPEGLLHTSASEPFRFGDPSEGKSVSRTVEVLDDLVQLSILTGIGNATDNPNSDDQPSIPPSTLTTTQETPP